MGSKNQVQAYTQRAIHAKTVEEKLNALAGAIYELSDFVDDLENKLNSIERQIKR